MRKLVLTFTFLICTMFSYGQADQKVADLINSEDFIEMNRIYPTLKDSMFYPKIKLMAEIGMNCAFNKPLDAIVLLDSLFRNHVNDLDFGSLSHLVMLTSEQLAKLGRYKEAEAMLKTMADACTDASLLTLLKSQHNKYKGLCNTPKSEIIIDETKPNKVKMVTDIEAAKHSWHIPVEINGKIEPFIFDTGASYTIISTSFAKKHNVKIVADSVLVSGISYLTYSSIGVIDSLKVGNMTYTNVPVYIIDELIPKNDKIGFTIDAIIGLAFMEPIGVIKIHPYDMEIEFGGNYEGSKSYNMTNFKGAIVVETFVNNIRALLQCDTGAGFDVWLEKGFYNRNKGQFANYNIKKDSMQIGGIGGKVQKLETHVITSVVPLQIGDKQVNSTDIIISEGCNNNGLLGVDFLRKQKKVIFDFNNMRLILE